MFRNIFKLVILFILNGSFLYSESKPNIVFLLADDMSRDTWGVYGSKDCKTPNIDKLASEGVRFDRAYCSTAMCAPFRQELYSGRTPWRTQTLYNHSKSVPETKSIAHYLKPLGYRVGLLGKSHVGPKESYPFEFLSGGDKKKDENSLLLKKTQSYIQSCRDEDKPFCLFIGSNDSHAPFTTGDRSAYKADELTVPPYWLDTPELRETMVEYYAEVTNFDRLVGMVRAELEAEGLWKNTIFMVCSEQGTQLPFAKWTCYDNGLHSGLVAHWPGVIKPGSVIDELVMTTDITPTLVNAVGGSYEEQDFDGTSFLKMLKGEKQTIQNYVYGAFTNCKIIDNKDRVFPIRVIRDKTYSLIFNPNYKSKTSNVSLSAALAMVVDPSKKAVDEASSWVSLAKRNEASKGLVHKLHHRPEYELYNRDKDPYELKNEIDNPEYKTVIEKLKNQLNQQLEKLNDSDPIATEKEIIKTKVKLKKKKNNKKK